MFEALASFSSQARGSIFYKPLNYLQIGSSVSKPKIPLHLWFSGENGKPVVGKPVSLLAKQDSIHNIEWYENAQVSVILRTAKIPNGIRQNFKWKITGFIIIIVKINIINVNACYMVCC